MLVKPSVDWIMIHTRSYTKRHHIHCLYSYTELHEALSYSLFPFVKSSDRLFNVRGFLGIMSKCSVLNFSMVLYKCLMLLSIPFCAGYSYSCHDGIPNGISADYSTWKLCVIKIREETLRLKIRNLFSEETSSTSWLSIGFPHGNNGEASDVPFFYLHLDKSFQVEQTKEVKTKKVNCSVTSEKKNSKISVDCNFKEEMNKYVKSKKIKILWKTGNSSVNFTDAGHNLIKNHSVLYFYPHDNEKDEPDEDAGSTAMRLLRNYGKSMGAIFGISFLLTALITVTICCCCKKKQPLDLNKQKLTKDASVSFYRDDSEGDGQSDESDTDEKAAFIRNNNERNSSV